MNTKKIFTALFVSVLASITVFAMDVNKEISRYTAEQQLLINAYKIMLDGEEDTMDSYTADENDTLIEILSMADGDWELVLDEFDSNYDLQDNEPEALWLRFLIDNTFKKKLDIEVLNNFAKQFKDIGFNSVKTYNNMQNTIVSCVKNLNPKNKSTKLETLEVVVDLAIKLADSQNIPQSVSYTLQDNTVKDFILNGNSSSPITASHDEISDTIKDDLNKKFKATLDEKQIDILVAQLKAKKMGNDQIIGTVENFLSDYCKDVKNPKAKGKKVQESLEVIAKLFNTLSASDNILQTVALTLSDEAVKNYILK